MDPDFTRRDRFYSRDGFMQHYSECEAAQRLWVSSKGGMAPGKKPKWQGLDGDYTQVRARGCACYGVHT